MLTVTLIGATRDAWGYLMNTVSTEHAIERATGKSAYYMADGTPPGEWAGKGISAFGFETHDEVKESHLTALFGDGTHPVTGATLGRKYQTPASLEERVTARVAAAIAAGETDGRSNAELAEHFYGEELHKPQKQSVAGFEFVFSPPKSVSTWWALADPALKDEIRQAHRAAIQASIDKLETDIVRTRIGADGIGQAHVAGISAALFDHWDSRNGDPQLHTHMIVSNRVQGLDGRWRTIDSRYGLMPAVSTAGEFYDSALMDELSARFGVDWTVQDVLEQPEQYRAWLVDHQRVDTPSTRHQFAIDSGTPAKSVKWQVDSVPATLMREFSSRSNEVVASKNRMVAEYVAKHGRQPSGTTVIAMRQAAALRTRSAKTVRSLKDLTTTWRERALQHVGDSFLFADRIRDTGKARLNDYPLWSFRSDDMNDEAARDAAELVLHELATSRATWGRRNAETSALRAIAGWRFRSPSDREQAVRRIVALVISQAIPLTPKNNLHVPYRFHTADGENMFRPDTRDLYTTAEVWDAEERLLQAGRDTSGVKVAQERVDALLLTPTGEEGRILSADQAEAVENLVSSGRVVDVLVGPAGAGKTTSLEKLRELWESQHGAGSVRGLAPTARAAEVLAESLGIVTENTAKWIHETARGTTLKEGFDYSLRPGDLMIVDEASIAGTLALDELRAQAARAGAKLLLVGDWAQLAAVDAGGAFGLLAADRQDVAELVNLHRFKAEWEAEASKLLRLGKTHGLDPYVEHGRVTSGLDETIVNDAVESWKRDEATVGATGDTTLTSLLIAPTNDMVERLNDIARAWRVEQGQVDATQEVAIASGVASPGDRIVTRQNARALRTDHDRWVKNNDEWEVAAINDATGDIVAASGEELVILPASYCRNYVQLAYATTAHRSQGRTVDTAHTIVDSSASRETFYVAMTRGKLSNRAYVVIDEDNQLGDASAAGMYRTWRETLDRVVLNKGGDIAAHDALRDEAELLGSVRQLVAEYQTLISDQLEREYLPTLTDLGLINTEQQESPYLGPVLANLRRVDLQGQNVPQTITALLAARSLEDAIDPLAVLHHRLATHLADPSNASPQAAFATGSKDALIAGLVERAPHFDDTDFTRALTDRELAIQLRAEMVADQAIADKEPWIAALGEQIPGDESGWRQRAVTVACYRDLYGVQTDEPLGREQAFARNRERDRQIAATALKAPSESSFSDATATSAASIPPAFRGLSQI